MNDPSPLHLNTFVTSDYLFLREDHRALIHQERIKAKQLKHTHWWKNKIQKGICEICEQKVPSAQLTMDHIVSLARGGKSSKGNIVAACWSCNQSKKLKTPAEALLESQAFLDKEH